MRQSLGCWIVTSLDGLHILFGDYFMLIEWKDINSTFTDTNNRGRQRLSFVYSYNRIQISIYTTAKVLSQE